MIYDEDTLAEARREAAMDRFDRVAQTCADCGERWNPGEHRATRVDPAWCERPECPRCGGPAWEWLTEGERAIIRDRLEAEYETAEANGDYEERARVECLQEALR